MSAEAGGLEREVAADVDLNAILVQGADGEAPAAAALLGAAVLGGGGPVAADFEADFGVVLARRRDLGAGEEVEKVLHVLLAAPVRFQRFQLFGSEVEPVISVVVGGERIV